MWWKLLLLTLYLAVLFLLSRLLETVAWYEGGYLANRLLDPVSLSVKKLKMLLDQRGVSYAGVVEKQELTDLMEASGDVKDAELEMATLADGDDTSSTNFSCGSHFFEEVEDTKDSVWVVQIVRQSRDTFMRPDDWHDFVKRVSRFGVRTGIFDCSLDWRWCDRKQWFTSRLVLALPQGYRAKDNVVLKDYMAIPRTRLVLDWVNANLASRIKQITSDKELEEDWYTFNTTTDRSRIRAVLYSKLPQPPMFLSVLSVKFTERVEFGMVNPKTLRKISQSQSSSTDKRFDIPTEKLPRYVILTPERMMNFGSGAGEYLNYNSMALFLKSIHPEVNDIFLLSLVLVNVSCWLEICIVHGVVLKRIGHLLWHVGKWNFLLILLWLPTLALFQLPYMSQVLEYSLTGLRIIGLTQPMSWIRADWLWYSNNLTFIVAAFIVYALGVAFLHYKYQDPNAPPPAPQSEFWSIPWDSYTNYLFRPMSTLTQPAPLHQDYDLEVGMEMLIARLAVPNFWLRPTISSDYIHELPVWKYLGPSIDSDFDFGSDTDAMSLESAAEGEDCGSGTESVCSMTSNSSEKTRPSIFVCEKCRALQENAGKSVQQLEEERLESESACAKFLMDGDYKCSCQLDQQPQRQHHRKSPKKERHKKRREEQLEQRKQEAYSEMPSGMIATTDCPICLESHRYGVLLCGLPCGHCFHQGCIMSWLSRDNHCCPVCRWPAYKAKPCSLHLHAE